MVFDVETTGLDSRKDRIVSIAAAMVDFSGPVTKQLRRIYYVVNPGIPIPQDASRIHGIYNRHVKRKSPFKEFAKEIVEFFGDSPIIGYNVGFDVGFLNAELMRAGEQPLTNPNYCAMYGMRRILNKTGNPVHGLNIEKAAKIVGLRARSSEIHNADEDVNTTIFIAEWIWNYHNDFDLWCWKKPSKYFLETLPNWVYIVAVAAVVISFFVWLL